MNPPRRYENGEHSGSRHLHILGAEQNLPALDAICHYAADQRKKKDWNSTEKLIERQQKCRVAEPVDQPALRLNLHPRADAGSAGPNPHQAKIAILKCFKNPANHLKFFRGPKKPNMLLPCSTRQAKNRSLLLHFCTLTDQSNSAIGVLC